MFAGIYKKIITDFSKITLFFLAILVCFSLYQSKNFNLDASSDFAAAEEKKFATNKERFTSYINQLK